jgi:hypothetical protein
MSSYDGMYSDLSTRGTTNEILTEVLEVQAQVLAAEANVVALEASASNSASMADASADSADINATNATAAAASAISAQSAAAISEANAAQSAADALTNSAAALIIANDADDKADAAVATANGIAGTANTALTNSNTAISTANSAASDASAAVATANGIAGTANTALTNSNTAISTANSAVSTANTASTDASNAVSTANAASAAVASKANLGANSDITSLSGLTTALSIPQGGTGAITDVAARTSLGVFNAGQDYIHGLYLRYVGAKAVTIGGGSCYIPGGSNPSFLSPSDINLTGQTVANSTMYHVYVFYSGTTPSAEISTSAPVSYFGPARQKTGDATRRYVGSILSDSSGNLIRFTHTDNSMDYQSVSLVPFQVLSGGTATTSTAFSLSGVLPTTATSVIGRVVNGSSFSVFVRISSPSIGAVTSANGMYSFLPSINNSIRMVLDKGTLSLNYAYDSAPSAAGVDIFVQSYYFER